MGLIRSLKKRIKMILNKPVLSNIINGLNVHNTIKGRHGNEVSYRGAKLNNVKILFRGKENKIVISEGAVLKNCRFNLFGNKGTITIGTNCVCENVEFWLEDGGSVIEIGAGSTFGKTHFAAIEGKRISIGCDCMFSSGIVFQNSDSHSIFDLNGRRTNPAKDIVVGDHVWIGRNVICEKGSAIPNGCIVGAGAVVTKSFTVEDSVIAGNPARVIKEGIKWKRERV